MKFSDIAIGESFNFSATEKYFGKTSDPSWRKTSGTEAIFCDHDDPQRMRDTEAAVYLVK